MRGKGRKKRQFQEYPNCYGTPPENCAGRWHELLGREAPLMIELGAGRCDFSLGYAAQFPDWNVLAIDLKSERLWAGGRRALERGLHNVRFLRLNIEELTEVFSPGEVNKIWITFPDPYPRKKHAKRRMTGPVFQERYRKVINKNGTLNLKTDDEPMARFSLRSVTLAPQSEVIQYTNDLHNSPLTTDENRIITFYEKKWIEERQSTMKYLQWRLFPLREEDEPIREKDFLKRLLYLK